MVNIGSYHITLVLAVKIISMDKQIQRIDFESSLCNIKNIGILNCKYIINGENTIEKYLNDKNQINMA